MASFTVQLEAFSLPREPLVGQASSWLDEARQLLSLLIHINLIQNYFPPHA